MQINLLKRIVEKVAGESAVKIVDLLDGKKNVNEFIIAKKLNLTINQTRNLLYRLSHTGILTSIRKKDKRKGWYIYFWTFNIIKSLEILEEDIRAEIYQYHQQLVSKKAKRFYKCKICGREVTEESALITNFICSECGEVYELADNTPIVEDLAKSIAKLQKELSVVKEELGKEKAKADKKLSKLIAKSKKKPKEKKKQKNPKKKSAKKKK